MGTCTNGDIRIELQNDEDADFVCDQMKKIAELTEKRLKQEHVPHFNLFDLQVECDTFSCNVQSDRTQNGEFQVEQVIAQIKVWVKEGKIKPPYELQAELMVQHAGWFIDENEFVDALV
jgi:hypothetical protein